MQSRAPHPDFEFRDYLIVLRRRRWWLVAGIVVGLLYPLWTNGAQDKVYVASGELLLESGNATASAVATEIRVIESDAVKAIAVDLLEQAGVKAPGPITGSSDGESRVVTLQTESQDPSQAAQVVNTYLEAYLRFRREAATDAYLAEARDIEGRIGQIATEVTALDDQILALGQTAEAAALDQRRTALVDDQVLFEDRLRQLDLQRSTSLLAGKIVSRAAPPDRPVRPNPVRDTILGLILGLLLGVAVALFVEYLDDKVRDPSDVALATGDAGRVLGAIPVVRRRRGRDDRVFALSEPHGAAAEAYRSLRTSLYFVDPARSARTITVTSPRAQEGKTTTAANLAVVLAQADRKVLLIDCDLRRPQIHELFGLPNDPGLTSVVIGAPIESAVYPIADVDGLYVLPSGPIPFNAADLLSTTRFVETLGKIRDLDDWLVVIDAPPLLPVADPLLAAATADLTLMVVAAGVTDRRSIRRAMERLEDIAVPFVGIVVNQARFEEDPYRPLAPRRTRGRGPVDDLEDEDVVEDVVEDVLGSDSGRVGPESLPRTENQVEEIATEPEELRSQEAPVGDGWRIVTAEVPGQPGVPAGPTST